MRDIENPRLLHKRRLPPRSTVIPGDRPGIFYRNKEQSPYILSLNGEYDFQYGGTGGWDKIQVPSMWQFTGYGIPRYTNTEYPFPFHPPYAPRNNPTGRYRRTFFLQAIPPRAVLHFAGVDGAFYVWINGQEAGFSKGSRLPAEFDVTEFLHPGENQLEVLVYTYSDASYLEGQDMILASGIFRDIYLILTGSVTVWDYEIRTNTKEISVDVALSQKAAGYTLQIEAGGQRRQLAAGEGVCGCCFSVKSPVLWNAEEPHLYDVRITLLQGDIPIEVHTKRVGLREVEIQDGVLRLNGQPIKFKGVNRHEYLPDRGRAIDYETTRKELLRVQDGNLNAIRCAHYPNNPYFYELCTELGIYVVDEADLETHGCGVTGDQGWLSKDPAWRDAYLDRVERMYARDKNETCILIWSIGNECGNGENLNACAEWLRQASVQKPVLYAQDDAHSPGFTDFRQCGYCPLFVLDQMAYETGKLPNSTKPVLMTEYAHAMGNSPGALQEYWERIYRYPEFCGGFVWEFKNHGIARNGTYLYGGDFGEPNHAFNFCLDGFLFSDGTPKPAWQELKAVSAPVWFTGEPDGVLITNHYDFKNLSELTIAWKLYADYQEIDAGVLDRLDIPPHGCRKLAYPRPGVIQPGARYSAFYTAAEGDRLLAEHQVALPFAAPAKPYEKADFIYTAGQDFVQTPEFEARFQDGMLCYYAAGGTVYLDTPMRCSFYRKPTDNDGIRGKLESVIRQWDGALLADFQFCPETKEQILLAEEARFIYRGKIMPEGKFAGFDAEIIYHVYQDGMILTEMTGKPFGKLPEVLPRIGVAFQLDRRMGKAVWYGRGPHENYPDRKYSAPAGLYTAAAAEMSVAYERPQENGNRSDTRYLALKDQDGHGLLFIGCEQFDFSIHPYALDSLLRAEHLGELPPAAKNTLYLDYQNRGLGSASCGPPPEEPYELRPHAFRFAFLMGTYRGEADALKRTRMQYDAVSQPLSGPYQYVSGNITRENFECREE